MDKRRHNSMEEGNNEIIRPIVTLDEKRLMKLEAIAISRRMKVNEVINELIIQYVDGYKKIEF